jgi:YD repeat-containing protein
MRRGNFFGWFTSRVAISHRGIGRTRAMLHSICVLWLCAASMYAGAATQYQYDDAGRLIRAVNDSASIVYRYDNNGNLLSVNRVNLTSFAVQGFTPASGPTGSTISIYGTGFSSVATANTVTVGGASATVNSATTTTLTVTVPAAAITGPITVAVGGSSSTTSQNFVVLRPAVSSFTPAYASAGAAITLSGSNLNLMPGQTSIAVGTGTATTTSVTNSQITFTAPSSSGFINVNTPYGQATSATSLVVLPSGITTSNVVSFLRPVAGGAAQSFTISQSSKYAVLAFDAAQGQLLSVQLSSLVTSPSGNSVGYNVYSPSGASIASGSVTTGSMSIHLPPIATTGTYLVTFGSASNTSVQITAALESNVVLNQNGSSLSVSTSVPAQSKRFIVSGTAGQNLGLGWTSLVFTPTSTSYAYLYVDKPDGSSFISGTICYKSNIPGCQLSLRNLPVTGNYGVRVVPGGTATMSFNITLSQDASGTLIPGTTQNLNLSSPGQNALLNFTATAGQTVALNLGSIVTTPANTSVYTYVYNAGGTQIGSMSGTTNTTLNLTNLAAGTYSVLIVPLNAATATAQVTLANAFSATLPVDGSTASYSSTVQGQNGYFIFAGTAGQNLGLGLTGLAFTPTSTSYLYMYVDKPDGTNWMSASICYASNLPGCQLSLRNLPATGNYTVRIVPGGQSTLRFNLTLSQDVSGVLSAGTPLNTNLSSPGQNALLNFTATAGQTLALNVGSIMTTPANTSVYTYVYNAGGTQIGSMSGTTSTTLNLTNLAAGTYSVLIVPLNAATATAQVALANALSGNVPVDGSTSPTYASTLQGQYGYFTFAGTAGQNLGLAVTNLTFNPATTGIAYIYVDKPDGTSWITATVCYSSNGGCQLSLRNLPSTGNYTVRVAPNGQSTMTLKLTLSQDVSGTLTFGTPFSLNLASPGQNALLTFSTVATQNVSLNMASISAVPAGRSVSLYVYNASGAQVGVLSGTSSATLNLTNLAAGTYSVLIAPQLGATATLQVTAQ